jgi:hypothetical protein
MQQPQQPIARCAGQAVDRQHVGIAAFGRRFFIRKVARSRIVAINLFAVLAKPIKKYVAVMDDEGDNRPLQRLRESAGQFRERSIILIRRFREDAGPCAFG